MSEVRSYRDLIVWQRAMDVAASTYKLTRDYPREELFGLTSQSRRAAASIAANIARPIFFLRSVSGSLAPAPSSRSLNNQRKSAGC